MLENIDGADLGLADRGLRKRGKRDLGSHAAGVNDKIIITDGVLGGG